MGRVGVVELVVDVATNRNGIAVVDVVVHAVVALVHFFSHHSSKL